MHSRAVLALSAVDTCQMLLFGSWFPERAAPYSGPDLCIKQNALSMVVVPLGKWRNMLCKAAVQGLEIFFSQHERCGLRPVLCHLTVHV
eukprot:355101-Chlamydomonas_euryale.AAC.10